MEQGNTEVVVALIEELMQRNGLDSALGQRSPEELTLLLDFLMAKISDHRFQHILTQCLRRVIDLYSSVALSPKMMQEHGDVLRKFADGLEVVKTEVALQREL